MSQTLLIPLGYAAWSLLLVGGLYSFVRALTERRASLRARMGLGGLAASLTVISIAATGAALFGVARDQALAGLAIQVIVLAWPLGSFVSEVSRHVGRRRDHGRISHAR